MSLVHEPSWGDGRLFGRSQKEGSRGRAGTAHEPERGYEKARKLLEADVEEERPFTKLKQRQEYLQKAAGISVSESTPTASPTAHPPGPS